MTTFRAGAATDKGMVRANNQDSQLVIDGRLFAVADGMGGHRGGEVASATALDALAAAWSDTTASALRSGVAGANEAVFTKASHDPELRGMGTTLTALALVVGADGQERLAVANVGDSRAYLLRDELVQVTDDHSLVESLVRQGRLTAEEAVTHPQRNILTRALGIEPQVEVDVWELPAVPGDRFLLCSDGLFNEVDPPVITATLRQRTDPLEAATELVRLANEGGGRDNITCVVVDIVEGPGAVGDPATRVGTAASEPDLAGYGPTTTPTPAASVFDESGSVPPPPPLPPVPGAPAGGEGAVGGHDPPLIGALPDRLPDDEPLAVAAPRRARRFTWRVAVFIVALIALVGAVAGVLVYYGRNTYYVAFDTAGQVTIYKGRPGGFLIFDPTVAQATGINEADLRETDADRVHAQGDQATLADAEAFVTNLCASLRSGAQPSYCADTGGTSSTDSTDTTNGTSGTDSSTGGDSTTGGNTATTGKPSTATTAKPS